MPVNKLFGSGVALMGRALDVRSQRQGLIQSNIANLETPGYTVQEIPFAKVMEQAVSGGGALARTDPRHIAVDPAQMVTTTESIGENRPPDLDEEMLKLAENQLMYQVTARILSKRFEGLQYAIDEGGK